MTILRITFMGGPLDGKYREMEFHKIKWEDGVAEGVEYLCPMRRPANSFIQEGEALQEVPDKAVYTLEKVGEHFFFMYQGIRR